MGGTACYCHRRAIRQKAKTRPLSSLDQLKNEVNWPYNKIFQRAVFDFWHKNLFFAIAGEGAVNGYFV